MGKTEFDYPLTQVEFDDVRHLNAPAVGQIYLGKFIKNREEIAISFFKLSKNFPQYYGSFFRVDDGAGMKISDGKKNRSCRELANFFFFFFPSPCSKIVTLAQQTKFSLSQRSVFFFILFRFFRSFGFFIYRFSPQCRSCVFIITNYLERKQKQFTKKKIYLFFSHNACTFFLYVPRTVYFTTPCSEFWNSFLPR